MNDMPLSLGELEAGWLHEQLVANGHDSPGVSAVQYTPMPGIVGVLGEVGIVAITYAGETDLPGKMVAKCPLQDEMAQMVNSMMGAFVSEAGFYRDLAHRMPMRVPTPYVVAENDDQTHQVLLIEYVDPATDGDVLEGTSFDNALTIVEDMAKLHGMFWMSDELMQLPWLNDWSQESLAMGGPMLQEAWGRLLEAEPDIHSPALRDALSRSFVNDTEHWLQLFHEKEGFTFVHHDYELDNLRFTPEGEIVVLDWQTCVRSFPGSDLSFSLAWLNTEETVAREDELMDHYRATFAAHGGPEWSRDEVIDQCAWGAMYFAGGMTMPYMSDQSHLPPDKEARTRRRFRHGLEGLIAGAERWQSAERLADLLR